MGQYWQIVNLDKKECLNPWDFEEVAKLREWPLDGAGGMATALIVLALDASSLGDGGGDWEFTAPNANEYVGRWHGDRVVVVGDYTKNEADYPSEENGFTDISKAVRAVMASEGSIASAMVELNPNMKPDMVIYKRRET